MSTETNQATVRRYYEQIWNQGNVDLIDELFAPGYKNHDPATPGGTIEGRDAFKSLVATYRKAIPDLRMDIVDQLSDGDRVVSRWYVSGTQRGAIMGIAPTNRRGEKLEGITITRFSEGRIVEDRVVWDLAGLLRVLGVLPA